MHNIDNFMQKHYNIHDNKNGGTVMVTKNFQKRVDADLLDRVSVIYQSLGTSVGDAFVMFLKKSEEVKGLPFELRQPMTDQELDCQLTEALMKNSVEREVDFSKPEDIAFFFDEKFPEYGDNHEAI